ncbi:hypothetical protein KIPB_014111, partial [Kipferlia bialata]|eukprot:g14111.t1
MCPRIQAGAAYKGPPANSLFKVLRWYRLFRRHDTDWDRYNLGGWTPADCEEYYRKRVKGLLGAIKRNLPGLASDHKLIVPPPHYVPSMCTCEQERERDIYVRRVVLGFYTLCCGQKE